MPHPRCPSTGKECLTASVAKTTAKRVGSAPYHCPECHAWHTRTPTPIRRTACARRQRERAMERAREHDHDQEDQE